MPAIHQWVSTIGGLILIVLAIIGFSVKTNQDRDKFWKKIEDDVLKAKEIADDKLAKAIAEGDEKRGRIYQRLDEVKKDFDFKIDAFRKICEEKYEQLTRDMADQYVPVKICKILHDSSAKEMEEIKDQIKAIFEELRKMNERLFEGKKI